MNTSLFHTAFDSAPFSRFKPEDYLPEIQKAIQEAQEEIQVISCQTEEPSFANTIEALSFSGEKLRRLSDMFFNLNSAETNETLQHQAQQIAPLLSDFQNDIYLNTQLFQRMKQVYQQQPLTLTAEQKTLLHQTYKNFQRNGAELHENQKETLREIDKELARLKLLFGENVLSQVQHYQLHIQDESQLKGLPDGAKQAAREKAQQKQLQGWIFTLDAPSYIPFMTYVEDRSLRKELFIAYHSRCFKGNFDNQKIILQITQLRQKRAQLLGYPTHATFVLENRMAQHPQKVISFLHELLEKALPKAKKELQELSDFAQKTDKIDTFQKWDTAFYSEKLKRKKFLLDDEKLKPFFELNSTIQGLFKVAQKLYGLHFEKITNVDTYHKDVTVYQVLDSDRNFVALLYTDFHPRAGKRAGAWMTSFKEQFVHKGTQHRPHISIVCNFTPPTENQPSLLTFNEVTTLFHEFGHALHGMLSQVNYPTLSGTNVFWDFVELPSQIMENWCYRPETLSLFARHYQTGEIIPQSYVENIKAASQFMEGLQTLRQLGFGLLDIHWHHTANILEVTEVKKWEQEALFSSDLYPEIDEICVSCSFSHIFQGGYSAGYYSYKWAEVLDADAFEVFEQNGVFDSETALRFKNEILSKGGSEHPMELYLRFRGQSPSTDALLRRSGLLD